MQIFQKSLFLIFSIVFISLSFAQNQDQNFELAEQYFNEGELEKALSIYEKLAEDDVYLDRVYKHYLICLDKTKDYKTAEKIIERQIKNYPEKPKFTIDLAQLEEKIGNQAKADKIYGKMIEKIKRQEVQVVSAFHYLLDLQKVEIAEKLLFTARKASKEDYAYAAELGDLYLFQNRKEEMMNEYINIALADEKALTKAQGLLQDRLENTEDFTMLENILLQNIQDNPKEVAYNQLLLWLYLQQRLFNRAFIQAKALDRRLKQEGDEMFDIGIIALHNKDYKAAVKFFEYIIEKYPKSKNYPVARHYFIRAKEEALKTTFPVKEEDITLLIAEYQALIDEFGGTANTIPAMKNMALLYAFYLDDKEKATEILENAINLGGNNNSYVSACKLALGDIYLLKEEPWEATLIYSQVEKAEKENPIGHEAKLKNAKLSFFEGDFQLSQEHLDILKEATSREISNDAMDLSLLIRDNLFLDTLGKALQEYADVELLFFQNRYTEALNGLEQMEQNYSSHAIMDEVLWKKANLLLMLGRPEEAIEDLEKVLQKYAQDILADDAHFLIGKIYEENLQDLDKAMEYYKNHLIDYKGSIHVVEARKRFRILRGDFVN